jgi:hypothetical protein
MKGAYYFRGIGVFRIVVTVWHSVPPGTSVGTNSRKIISEKINVLPLGAVLALAFTNNFFLFSQEIVPEVVLALDVE